MPTSFRNAFLTPSDLEGESECKELSLPVPLLRYAYGALAELTVVDNWEQEGEVTPEEAANYFDEWLYELVSSQCQENDMLTITLTRPTTQLIAFNTLTRPNWTIIENDGGFAYEAQTKDFTVLLNGWYLLQGSVYWNTANAGSRLVQIQNVTEGINIAMEQVYQGVSSVTAHSLSRTVYLESGTIVAMSVYNNTVNGVNIGVGSYVTQFKGTFLGDF